VKLRFFILSLFCVSLCWPAWSQQQTDKVAFDFYGDTISFTFDKAFRIDPASPVNNTSITDFYSRVPLAEYEPMLAALVSYKQKNKPDDWLFYQLIRKTVQHFSPKADDYARYTLYKWLLLAATGYNATLSTSNGRILLYIQSDEDVSEIPFHLKDGKQYVCLNYHDYPPIDFANEVFAEAPVAVAGATHPFSYKVTQLPPFRENDYVEKNLNFSVYQNEYHFKIKLNPQVKTIFANYPVVDYASCFNIPMSRETYSTLIPLLKENTKGLNVKNGVDFLMRFTRYSFLFEKDTDNFGKEKRLTPEQTLLFERSDCEDRVSLFFYLVKEIYNLPMIVLSYPNHITVAVKFDKPVGKPILYNGQQYSVCEPTPQKQDLNIGQAIPELKHVAYEVVYAYTPKSN